MAHRLYRDETKAETVEIYKQVGLNECVRRTGVDRTTVLRWVKAASVDRQQVNRELSERNRLAAAASHAKVERERLAARERIIDKTAKIAEGALAREGQLIAQGGFSQDHLQALSRARETAVKQLELLTGRPTSRSDPGPQVERILLVLAGLVRDAFEHLVAQHELSEAAMSDGLRFVTDRLRALETEGVFVELDAGDVIEGDAHEVAEGEAA